MAKKNYDKKNVNEEIKEVLEKAVINEEPIQEVVETIEEETEVIESLLPESLALDTEKLSQELDEIGKEIFETAQKEIETKVEVENKKKINRIFGLTWNGQEFDY